MANGRRPAADEPEGSRAGARRRVIQWIAGAGAPVPAPLAAPAAPSSSSSSNRSLESDDSRDTDSDARRCKAERDDTRRELEVISKQAGIADLEWQHERKQLLEVIDARDAELDRLKALVEELADKVNAQGDTPEARLGAVAGRVDEVASHGVRLGVATGLVAMSTHTGTDYSRMPVGFANSNPEDIDDIDASTDRLDGHGAAIADSIHPQSVLNRLFQ
ncbi:hypothetical protein OsI_29827 [Oryza sativa Indica Group]|uniref:Uncharacterized protein n=1 Tax=Oryza sativa subsp. indica TaxID=39946 RepID=A2YWW5_ORYSI|nr:hypothetical protein OsI_29827 [Oryza sativa Indica Group]